MTDDPGNLGILLLPGAAAMQISLGPSPGKPVGTITMSADQLDTLIAGLAGIRSKMTPAIPQHFPMGKPTHHHDASKYFLAIEPFSGTPLLSFRSPGLGWLTFSLPEADLEKILRLIQESKGRLAPPHGDTTH